VGAVERQAEGVVHVQRRQRVQQVVACDEVEGQLDLASSDGERCVRAFAVHLCTQHVAWPEAPDLEVLATQVRSKLGHVGRDDRDAARRKSFDQLGLGLCDRGDGPDELEVDRPHARDHADLRPRDRRERGDLAEPSHRELEHAGLGVRLEPAEGERYAELVVEARLRGDGARDGRTQRVQDVLRRGFPGRARDPDDTRAASLADRRAERADRRERVLRHERRCCAASARVGEEVLPRPDRDEEIARLDEARVDLDAGDTIAARLERSDVELLDLCDRQRDHACTFALRSSSRATSRSSNGSLRSANS